MNSTPYNWKEARHLRAWHLRQQGWPQRQIAKALGVSEGAVSQWMARAREVGPEALRRRPPSGVELRNVCCFNIPYRKHELRDAVKQVRRKPRLITRDVWGVLWNARWRNGCGLRALSRVIAIIATHPTVVISRRSTGCNSSE